MPCHDILVQTSILEANQKWIDLAEDFWKAEVSMLGLVVPVGFNATAVPSRRSYDDLSTSLALMGLSSLSADQQSVFKTRYEQAYVAAQIFAALEADGYQMTADFTTDYEGMWSIEARDLARNATIGVKLYHTLEFDIDFLDASHSPDVWLTGGEFGRVLEFLKRQGLGVDVLKLDVDEDARRALATQLYA